MLNKTGPITVPCVTGDTISLKVLVNEKDK